MSLPDNPSLTDLFDSLEEASTHIQNAGYSIAVEGAGTDYGIPAPNDHLMQALVCIRHASEGAKVLLAREKAAAS